MSQFHALITARDFDAGDDEAFRILREAGCEIVMPPHPSPLTEVELMEWLPGIDGVAAGSDPYTERVFAAADRLKVVSRRGVGYDAVDLDAATRHRVVVANVPGLNADAVADYALAMLLAVARGAHVAHQGLTAGRWEHVKAIDVCHKTLGIVGLGNIGKKVARRAHGFDMNILAFDIRQDAAFAQQFGVSYVTLDELLANSDFVTLHTELTPESRGMIDEPRLRQMRPTAYLINCARGALVDEGALAQALQEGWIAGAALDAFSQEPLPADHPFRKLDNCFATPHCAFNTTESARAVNVATAQNLVAVLAGQRPASVVNPAVYAAP